MARRRIVVLVTGGATAAALAAKAATTTVPIVFVIGGDPVKVGLVASLSRPGGNVTGVSFLFSTLAAKQVEVLHEAVPQAASIGVLMNPANPNVNSEVRDVHLAADALGTKLIVVKASNESEFEVAFDSLINQGAKAIFVSGDALFNNRSDQLIALTKRHALPAIYPIREAALAGGLMSYGPSIKDALRQSGIYAGRILKGEKPADLPVQQSTKIEFIINLKAASTLGLTFPLSLLGRADEVIE